MRGAVPLVPLYDGMDRKNFTLTVGLYDGTLYCTARGHSVVGSSDWYSGGPGFNSRSFYLY
jgi:hypothetical protein